MKPRWPTLLIILLAVVAFLPALANGPLEDDWPQLHQRLGHVRRLADLPALLGQSYWGNLHRDGLYRPLTLVTLAVQHLIFGERLWLFRLVSLLLHVGCSLLCMRLALDWLRRDATTRRTAGGLAVMAGALFAVHPVHAEAVITVYGQADLWAGLFALLALVLDLQWRRQRRAIAWWVVIAGLLLVSLGFKESALALPVIIWLLNARRERWWRPDSRSLIVAGAWLVYFPIRWMVLGHDLTPPDAVGGGGVGGQEVAACVALFNDVRLLVLPWGQTIYYGHLRERLVAGGSVEMVAVALMLVAASWTWREKGPAARAGLILLGGFILPVANVVPIGTLVAERTLYLPSVGGVLLAIAVCGPLLSRWRRGGVLTPAAAVCGVGLLLCWRMDWRWQTERSAWEASLEDHPRSARTLAEVVRLRLRDPDLPDTPQLHAELHAMLAQARLINPNSPQAYLAMADLAEREHDPAAADYAATAEKLLNTER